MRSLAISCSAPSTVVSKPHPPAPLPHGDGDGGVIAWLVDLMQQHGPGEYIVRLSTDGRITVKRPQAPLRFEWNPDDAQAR